MRVLFWILLLGNVVFFAAMQWGGGLVADERLTQAQPALHEERVRLLTAPVTEPVETPFVTAESASSATMPDIPVCMEWGDFSGADLARATAALSALQLGDRLSQYQVEHAIGYWVYIPPLKNKAAVNQKIAQLKERGIGEYFVVSDAGPWLNAISLGVFKTQEAAQSFLDDLRQTRDIRTVQIGERTSKFKTTVFALTGLDAATVAEVTEIQKAFSGSTLKNVSCAHIDNAG